MNKKQQKKKSAGPCSSPGCTKTNTFKSNDGLVRCWDCSYEQALKIIKKESK